MYRHQHLLADQQAKVDVNRMLILAEHFYHRQLHLSAYVIDVEHYMLQICMHTVRDNEDYIGIHKTSSFCLPDFETARM